MLRASLEDQASAGDRAAAVQCLRLSAHEPSDAADLWFTPRQYVWYSYSGVQYVGVQMAGVCASVLNKVNMFAQWTHQRNSSVWFVFFPFVLLFLHISVYVPEPSSAPVFILWIKPTHWHQDTNCSFHTRPCSTNTRTHVVLRPWAVEEAADDVLLTHNDVISLTSTEESNPGLGSGGKRAGTLLH